MDLHARRVLESLDHAAVALTIISQNMDDRSVRFPCFLRVIAWHDGNLVCGSMHFRALPLLSKGGMCMRLCEAPRIREAACSQREFLGSTPAFDLVLPPDSAGSISE